MDLFFAPFERNFLTPLKTGANTFLKRSGFILKNDNHYAEASSLIGLSFDFALSALNKKILWKDPVSTAALIGIDDFKNQKMKIDKYINEGFRTFKFKISPSTITEAAKLLHEVKTHDKALRMRMRIDANKSFTFKEAINSLPHLENLPIEYWEDPLDNENQLEEFSKHCPFPLAADEGLLKENDFHHYLKSPYEYFILKPSLLGPEEKIKEMITLSKKADKKIIFSSALESEIGLQEIFRLASLYGEGETHGLGTLSFFKEQYLSYSPYTTSPPLLSLEGKKWLDELPWARLNL